MKNLKSIKKLLYLFGIYYGFVALTVTTTASEDLLEPAFMLSLKKTSFIPLLIAVLYIVLNYPSLMKATVLKKLTRIPLNIGSTFPKKNIQKYIIGVSAFALFMELAIIRLHSIYFPLFAFLKNVSLLSCFLGFGIGFLLTKRDRLLTALIAPLFAIQIAFIDVASITSLQYLLQNPILESYAMGLSQTGSVGQNVFIYFFVALVFSLNALCFVPVGHLISTLMSRTEKLPAYTANLVGSLVGILMFAVLSYLWSPPIVWISIGFLLLTYTLKRQRATSISLVASLAVIAFIMSLPKSLIITTTYSPYQVIETVSGRGQQTHITANKTYFQQMNVFDSGNGKLRHYDLPYLLNPNPTQVLVVGSGTGNDVAAGLKNDAGSIDAVEIDPVVVGIGKRLHPDNPYGDDRVTVHINDARNYIKSTDKKYDIVSYGHLDSHTLLSGKSSVRLDSYVYTVEAFREARATLSENGVISLSFATNNPVIIKKLYLMLQTAFDGKSPHVFVSSGVNFLIGEDITFDGVSLPENVKDITSEIVNSSHKTDIATDNWPFLYMPIKTYPYSLVVIVTFLLIISVAMIRQITPSTMRSLMSIPFFLGAGFMLIETKSITELALYFGSTWIVSGIAITAILSLAVLSNVYVMKYKIGNINRYYLLLFISILLSYVSTTKFIDLGSSLLTGIFVTILITLPVLFSGIIFSYTLKNSKNIGIYLGSNLLGAMLGGFMEYNSMYFGYQSLYLLAGVLYLLAFYFFKQHSAMVKK